MSAAAPTVILLVGHGAVPTDVPEETTREWRALRSARRAQGDREPSARERQLDELIRRWPRSADNDPYHAGVERVAASMGRELGGMRVELAFHELCFPGVVEAIDSIVSSGCTRVVAITTMVTPGGGHAERDIPAAIERAKARHPDVAIQYVGPLQLHEYVARFMASAVRDRL